MSEEAADRWGPARGWEPLHARRLNREEIAVMIASVLWIVAGILVVAGLLSENP
jgi:hypothetical protein